jgi:hypothetical protein
MRWFALFTLSIGVGAGACRAGAARVRLRPSAAAELACEHRDRPDDIIHPGRPAADHDQPGDAHGRSRAARPCGRGAVRRRSPKDTAGGRRKGATWIQRIDQEGSPMRLIATSCAVLLTASAGAQTATVTISHNHPTGVVVPGQVVRIRLHAETSTPSIARPGVSGDLLPTPAAGSSSNVSSPFPSGPLVNLGSPASGGVVDFGVVGVPPGPFIEFDWTAPGLPGPVVFDYQPAAAVPTVRLYPSLTSPVSVAVAASVTTATLTVIPAPAALPLLVGVAALRRRSRP